MFVFLGIYCLRIAGDLTGRIHCDQRRLTETNRVELATQNVDLLIVHQPLLMEMVPFRRQIRTLKRRKKRVFLSSSGLFDDELSFPSEFSIRRIAFSSRPNCSALLLRRIRR